ncbi:MAG: hypothetical protein SAK29_09730 [Scytonema sp. PMC 1069.18]|nr:hypothetical protein [Scytonema sp. PMC 1069.18]MEC4886559.1 hypothetical protein [Scytonema sp. PMC 1070.18]
MKRFSIATGVGTIAFIVLSQTPFLGNHWETGIAIAQAPTQVQLRLNADKKVVKQVQGTQKVSWEPLQGKALIQPGEVLRYTVTAVNNNNTSIKNLTINQPVPLGMVYILNSATTTSDKSVKMTYSIDGGHSFVEKPVVKVTLLNGKIETKPAPATIYTHIRWNFETPLPAKTTVKGIYQVQVR